MRAIMASRKVLGITRSREGREETMIADIKHTDYNNIITFSIMDHLAITNG